MLEPEGHWGGRAASVRVAPVVRSVGRSAGRARPGPRWSILLVAVAVLATGAVLTWRGPAPIAAVAPITTTTAPQPATTVPGVPGPGGLGDQPHADMALRRRVLADLAGPALPEIGAGSGLRLIVLGVEPGVEGVLDVDAGTFTRIWGLRGAKRLVGRVGGAAAVQERRAFVAEVRPGGLGPVDDVGRAETIFASESPDAVWVAEAGKVSEFGIDGRARRGPVEAPAFAAAAGGLLVGSSGGVEVRSPEDGRVLARIEETPFVIGAAQDWVAGAHREALWCHVLLTNVRTGERKRVQLLPHDTCLQGRAAFSPDGRWLAVPAAEYVFNQGQVTGALILVDVERGQAAPVPRASRRVPIFDSLTWSPSGEWLVWLDPIGGQSIGAYRVGSDGAVSIHGPEVDDTELRAVAVVGG